jgi:hypothetical protein
MDHDWGGNVAAALMLVMFGAGFVISSYVTGRYMSARLKAMRRVAMKAKQEVGALRLILGSSAGQAFVDPIEQKSLALVHPDAERAIVTTLGVEK